MVNRNKMLQQTSIKKGKHKRKDNIEVRWGYLIGKNNNSQGKGYCKYGPN